MKKRIYLSHPYQGREERIRDRFNKALVDAALRQKIERETVA